MARWGPPWAPHALLDPARTAFKFIAPPRMIGFDAEARYESWREALSALEDDVAAAQPFDVALVAAGGYALPACHFIRAELNRTAVFAGGQLQLWFGIMGERWRDDEDVQYYVQRNADAWMRPPASARPAGSGPHAPDAYW